MKHSLIKLCGAGALVLPLSVWAQDPTAPTPATDPGQATGSGNIVLFNQLQTQQDAITQLQGQIEELQHQLQEQQRSSVSRYEALEKRVGDLEARPAATPGADTAPAAPAADDKAPDATAVSPESDPVQQAYQHAFDLMQGKKNDQAISEFDTFIKQHPDSSLKPNALFWLGELYSKAARLDDAAKALDSVVKDFPKSNKRADAMYKLGLIKARQGKIDVAQSTLQQVSKEYPKTSAADKAAAFLKKVGG